MSSSLVITFTGPDQPGVVDRLAGVVAGYGGNWEGSRLATFAGRFAGVIKVTVASHKAAELRAALAKLSSADLRVQVDTGVDDAKRPRRRGFRLELTGADHLGIVQEIAAVLASRQINIEELSTEQFEAPLSGEPMFQAIVWIECPPDVDMGQLRASLETLAHDLVVEIHLHTPTGS